MSTIYDVARQADVSIVTVSRVLNDYPHVSKRMRARVIEAARVVGFSPKLVAKPRRLAVIIGHLDRLHGGHYKSHLLMRMIGAAARRGYAIDFIPAENVDIAVQRSVDGAIELGLTSLELGCLDRLPDIPVVLVNKEVEGREAWSTVCSDHRQEARKATQHLVAQGHRRIALIVDEDRGWSAEHRLAGYRSVMRKATGKDDDQLVISAADVALDEAALRIIQHGCTALVNFTDNAGLDLIGSLQQLHRIRIPQDMSVVGLEHEGVSQNLSPPMTTIKQPLDIIAETAISGLLDAIEDGDETFHHMFASHLIERESVKPPPAARPSTKSGRKR